MATTLAPGQIICPHPDSVTPLPSERSEYGTHAETPGPAGPIFSDLAPSLVPQASAPSIRPGSGQLLAKPSIFPEPPILSPGFQVSYASIHSLVAASS